MLNLNEIAQKYGYELAEDTGIEKEGYEIYTLGFHELRFVGLPAFLLVKGEEVEMVGGEEGFELHGWLCENYYNDDDEDDDEDEDDDDEDEDEEDEDEEGEFCYWYKRNPTDKIWWLDDDRDQMVFSFDRIQKFYLFSAYPYKLTREQKEIFDKENPFWVDFFKSRTEEWEKTHKE